MFDIFYINTTKQSQENKHFDIIVSTTLLLPLHYRIMVLEYGST